MTIDLERITHPLRLARGSHQPGSGKGCAMNVISYINGDAEITDYPECSARPLAILVQACNDKLADSDGFLSPENSLTVLDLGWQTVGTAEVSDSVIDAWMKEMLDHLRRWSGGRRPARYAYRSDLKSSWNNPMDYVLHDFVRHASLCALRASRGGNPVEALVDFTRHAITTWRELAELDEPIEPGIEELNTALTTFDAIA